MGTVFAAASEQTWRYVALEFMGMSVAPAGAARAADKNAAKILAKLAWAGWRRDRSVFMDVASRLAADW
jgi:hypothetical protein